VRGRKGVDRGARDYLSTPLQITPYAPQFHAPQITPKSPQLTLPPSPASASAPRASFTAREREATYSGAPAIRCDNVKQSAVALQLTTGMLGGWDGAHRHVLPGAAHVRGGGQSEGDGGTEPAAEHARHGYVSFSTRLHVHAVARPRSHEDDGKIPCGFGASSCAAEALPCLGAGFSIFAMSAGSAVVVGNLMAGFLADQTVSMGLGSIGPFYAGLVSTLAAVSLLVVFELTLPHDSNRARFSLFKVG
jgi:hypothetical protein